MKTSRFTFITAAIVMTAVLTFSSCRKKEKEIIKDEPDSEQSTANDNNLAENTDNDMIAMGSQLSENSGTLTTYKIAGPTQELMFMPSCAVVTASYVVVSTNTIPVSYTVDFGTTACVGADGRARKGKLIYEFPNAATGAKWYRNPGFTMIVKSDGYSVDGNLVAINGKTVTNTTPNTLNPGPNPGINLTWSIKSDIQITKQNNEVVIWKCDRTKELINTSDPSCYNGQSTPINWTKAIVKLNGTANGTNAKQENFTATATNLVRDFNCTPNSSQPHRHPFVSGTIAYTPGNRPTRTVDYGSGSCDLNATLTVNGQTYVITLP